MLARVAASTSRVASAARSTGAVRAMSSLKVDTQVRQVVMEGACISSGDAGECCSLLLQHPSRNWKLCSMHCIPCTDLDVWFLWTKQASGGNIKQFKIYRWNPEDGQQPHVQTYPVDLDEYVKANVVLSARHQHSRRHCGETIMVAATIRPLRCRVSHGCA